MKTDSDIPADERPVYGRYMDRLLTHRVSGVIIFLFLMLVMFTCIFLLAQVPMDVIKHFFRWLAGALNASLPDNAFRDLLVNGMIAGVGSVIVFLPQILLLFFFISILEDSGYMARAALMMDRVMGRVGLPGRAFLPLLCSFGCAIPGIMGARSIKDPKDRLVTVLVAPLMCCSARWPVFFLMAGAVIPNRRVLGFLPLPALVLFGLLVLGIVSALIMASFFRSVLLRGRKPSPEIDFPPYRVPTMKHVLRVMWDRGAAFVRKAGTVILVATVVMWALSTFPRNPEATPQERIEQSFAGRIGRVVEPLIAPLGFNWKIGVAILSSFASREVFVSTMGTIYGVGLSDIHDNADLQAQLRKEVDPGSGGPYYTPLRAINIMIFYVLSLQCVSTFVVVGRETERWRWAIFQWGYMTGLAWVVCCVVWQAGRLLGWA